MSTPLQARSVTHKGGGGEYGARRNTKEMATLQNSHNPETREGPHQN